MLLLCAGCAGLASVITFMITGVPAPTYFLLAGTIFCGVSGVPLAMFAGSVIYPDQKEKERERQRRRTARANTSYTRIAPETKG
jgi:hypothetical protein